MCHGDRHRDCSRLCEEGAEPKLPPLSYLPGVSRIVLGDAIELARKAYNTHLNKGPLARNVKRRCGCTVPKDFFPHYGVIGSDGNLDNLPEPGIARDLRDTVAEKFNGFVQRQNARTKLRTTLLRAGGWFYLAMPEECFAYLRLRLPTAHNDPLSAVELHAIGLAFATPDDLRRFYPPVIQALRHSRKRPKNWLRAVRDICRSRNHALRADAISNTDPYRLIEPLFETLQEQAARRKFGQI